MSYSSDRRRLAFQEFSSRHRLFVPLAVVVMSCLLAAAVALVGQRLESARVARLEESIAARKAAEQADNAADEEVLISEEDSEGNHAEPQRDIAAIDKRLQDFMRLYAIPGASIAITKDGNLVYAKSYGQQSPDDKTPISNSSLFRIASLSKPITSAGIMKLLEGGKLRLSDKVFGPSGILKDEFPKAPQATYNITVDNLLTHTTGVWGNDGKDPMFQKPAYNQKQLIAWTLQNYPANRNRGTYVYSNFGYSVLGRVIEKLSGKSYEQFIKDNVLSPSDIEDMQIAGNTKADRKDDEVLYTGQDGNNPYGMNVARMDSHGGWLATATDLARFMVRVDGFSGLSQKQDILKANTIKTMTTPPAKSIYAKGWDVNKENNWWHTGSLPGTATEMIRSAKGFNWVVLCNSRSYADGFDAKLDGLLWPVINDASTPWQEKDQF